MNVVKISEGISNHYLAQGITVMIVGLLGFFLSAFIAIPIIAIAIGLLSARTGLLVNMSSPAYKYYTNIFGIIFGDWVKLENITGVTLFLHTEITSVGGVLPNLGSRMGPIGSGRAVSHSRSYDLLVSDGITTEPTLINDFMTYKNARKAFDVLCDTCQVEGRDLIAEQIAENQERRSRR